MKSRYQDSTRSGPGGRFAGLMSLHDAASAWGLEESTVRKAIAAGRFQPGKDAQKFGKQWIVTREAMSREFDARRISREATQKIENLKLSDRFDSMDWPE